MELGRDEGAVQRARPSSSLLTTAVQVLFALLHRKLMMVTWL